MILALGHITGQPNPPLLGWFLSLEVVFAHAVPQRVARHFQENPDYS